jgi:hypothetical protein
MSSPDENVSAFNVFSTGYIEALAVLNVAEVVSLVCEHLPPTRISLPDLQVG